MTSLACSGFFVGAAAGVSSDKVFALAGFNPVPGSLQIHKDTTVDGVTPPALGDSSFFSATYSQMPSGNPAFPASTFVQRNGGIRFQQVFNSMVVVAVEGTYRRPQVNPGLDGRPIPGLFSTPFTAYYDLGQLFTLAEDVADPFNLPIVFLRFQEPAYFMTLTSVTLYTFQPGAPIPEPGTWALMAAGLLGVGALARRRAVKSLR